MFSSTICFHSESGASTTGPSSIMPALLISVSKRPSSPTVCATAAVASASSVTSVSNTNAVPPRSRTAAATASSRSFRRAASATAAPCAARATAVAAPMPLDAPVTRATVPSNRSCRDAGMSPDAGVEVVIGHVFQPRWIGTDAKPRTVLVCTGTSSLSSISHVGKRARVPASAMRPSTRASAAPRQ